MALTGIILAGGKSSRMGQDKALFGYQGKRMIDYTLELLKPICSEILISTNQSGYEQFGVKLIADRYKNCGPLGGLHATLSKSSHGWNIVVSCDTPFLNHHLFNRLLNHRDQVKAVIPTHKAGVEPMAGLYHRSLANFFEAKINAKEFKLQKILKEVPVCFLNVDDLLEKKPDLFYNFNSPSDVNFRKKI